MNAWGYLAVHDAAAFAAACYLIENGHPRWAGLCFFLIALTTITTAGSRRMNQLQIRRSPRGIQGSG